jgi:hypothetical protein
MEIVSDFAVVAVVTFALQHLICISTVNIEANLIPKVAKNTLVN